MRHLHEIRFTELDCDDSLDNDADSLTDAQDPECRDVLASAFCATASNKTYCSSQFSNSSDFLVTCSNHTLVGSPEPGRCVENPAPANDTMITTNIPEPSGTGRWCSAVYRPSLKWAVATEVDGGVTNRDPCAFLNAQRPAGQFTDVLAAGLFSLNGVNNVVGVCDDGAGAGRVDQSRTTGTAPIDDIKQLLKDHPGCRFLVSPANLPIFDLPYDKASVTALGLTITYGLSFDPGGHGAWDISIPKGEGVPVLAVANGKVVGVVTDPNTGLPHGGSEDLPQEAGTVGDSHQPGIAILHNVQTGASGRYRESFVSVYNHVRQRIVAPGQVVKKGQIIGYVGQAGQASGPHIHFGVVRLSNTVLSLTDNDASTVVTYDPWPINKNVTLTSVVSPFGWRGPSNQQDVWGTNYFDDGKGAFSPNLWNTNQTPSPAPAVTTLGY